MTPEARARWRERLRAVTPIEVTDQYGELNPDYILTKEFDAMVEVIVTAVAEENEACAQIATGLAFGVAAAAIRARP